MDLALIQYKVNEIIAENMNMMVHKIEEDMAIHNLLYFEDILCTAEDEFDVAIPEDEAEKIKTVGDLVDKVNEALEEQLKEADADSNGRHYVDEEHEEGTA